ncbi:MAG: hypothetical protein MJA29_07475 [Candidatus Omnitrophica bacterium]|nr:hypothetical protein [Candidatus Omnitrophota bacterium]
MAKQPEFTRGPYAVETVARGVYRKLHDMGIDPIKAIEEMPNIINYLVNADIEGKPYLADILNRIKLNEDDNAS